MQHMGIPDDRITVIPNFTRVPAVDEAGKPAHDPPRLLAYGRFVDKKGFADLIHALALLRDRGVAFELKLGGDGPLNASLRNLVRELGLENSIHFSGWLHDVVTALDDADLFVLPSRSEPFGIVVLEAMARGVPVVSTRTEGPAEILSDDTAILAAVNNPADLAAAIEKALADRAGSVRRAITALAIYQREYTPAAVIPRITQVYRKLASVD